MKIFATGLQFPEGPVAMPDGTVLVVEIARGTLSRVPPDGGVEIVANIGGGPNGAAVGPDGRFYICNNGGFALGRRARRADRSAPRRRRLRRRLHPARRPATGAVEVLYDACDGNRLSGAERHRVRHRTAASGSPISASAARPHP